MATVRSALYVAALTVCCSTGSGTLCGGAGLSEEVTDGGSPEVPNGSATVACDCHEPTCGIPCSPPICPNGETLCANACVNTEIDPTHCGYCGVTCAAGLSCQDGGCASLPDAGAPGDAELLDETAPPADASSDGTMEEAGVALDGSTDLDGGTDAQASSDVLTEGDMPLDASADAL